MPDLPWYWRTAADATEHGPYNSRTKAKAAAKATGLESKEIALTRREEEAHG